MKLMKPLSILFFALLVLNMYAQQAGHEDEPWEGDDNDSLLYFKHIYAFHEGLAAVKDFNGKWGYVDENLHLVIPFEWKYASEFSEGFAAVCDSNERVGYINIYGKMTVPCKWNYDWNFHRFCEGLARVDDGMGVKGYMNKSGQIVIPTNWNNRWDYGDFFEGLAWFENSEGLYGYIDKTGEIRIPCKWKLAFDFKGGIAIVKDKEGNDYLIDKQGYRLFRNYNIYGSFNEGLAPVTDKNGLIGFINSEGHLAIDYKWSGVMQFNEGLCAVKDDSGHWGYIDKAGTLVIQYQWNNVWNFHEGLAAVKDRNGKWGYIDTTGKIVIPCHWSYALDFCHGISAVNTDDDRWLFIDRKGVPQKVTRRNPDSVSSRLDYHIVMTPDDKQSNIYEEVDEMPVFGGGDIEDEVYNEETGEMEKVTTSFPEGKNGLVQFLVHTIKYPADAQRDRIEGRVVVNFIVDVDGSISDIVVVKPVHPSLDEEAKRVVSLMPKWKPGRKDGINVRVKYTLPLTFQL